METEFFNAAMINLAINMIYTMLAFMVGVGAILVIDKVVYAKIDFEEELKKGNIAVGIFFSTILIFVAIIVSFGFKA